MLLSAIVEVVSLGAVVPFLGVLVAPEVVFQNSTVAQLAHVWGITSADQLATPLTVAFMVGALLAGGIRIFLLWATARVAFASGADLGIEVYRRTLYQPYHVHVGRNSSEVISGIINKVNGVIFGVLLALLTLVSSTLLLITVTSGLILINPMVAFVAASGFGASYGLITWMCRRQLRRNSERIAHEQSQVVKALQEGLGGIRDVLLDGTQPIYCDIYQKADNPLRRAQGSNTFIAGSPRYAMEAIGMVLIAALTYGLSHQDEGIIAALPLLGALALGAQRLLPALQQIYSAWANIVGNYASLLETIALLDQPLPAEILRSDFTPLNIQDAIRLESIRFRYSSEGPWVLDGVNLTIPKGSRVGFVGSTGSGKSTTLDLVMGLLSPTEGEVLVDGRPVIGEQLRAWQRNIAHVPQSIYLADNTVAENIAFGVPPEVIDLGRVRQAARQAQIASFIESSPEGYQTLIGERGIRLSGGQRQRIGIARALYKQSSVLVFDEATSALDSATEQSVMVEIEALNPDLTVLIIAHRLTTIRHCDIIFELERGRVISQGTYEELIQNSPSFRGMVNALI